VEIGFSHKPLQVLVNGNKIENWKCDSSGKVTLSFDQKSRTEKQTVKFLKVE
jgi:hypothetical protein